MQDDDLVADAIAALQAKTPLQRHAIVRLLKPDGPSLSVMRWIASQPDCDLATASMIFWRLLCLPPGEPACGVQDRAPVLEWIATRARANGYGKNRIRWEGVEAWHRTVLIGAKALPDLQIGEIPRAFFGPFRGEIPEPAKYAFFEAPFEEDDIFDSLWFINPNLVAAADWLIGNPAELWMSTADALQAGHPNDLYLWMVQQPECPAPVAGQIFWMCDPVWYSRGMLSGSSEKPAGTYASAFELLGAILDRWRAAGFAPADLDFSRYAVPAKYRSVLREFPGKADPLQVPEDLLDPVPRRQHELLRTCDHFDFWCIERSLAGYVPRPRSAAVEEWELSRKTVARKPSRKWLWF